MSNFIKLPKGTRDCLPEESYIWNYIEKFLRNKARSFGIKEIRTPIFEYTELFLRGVGNETDIVQKEMYTFNDKGNRSITLKAEGTAPTIRAFIEHSLYSNAQPTKMFYITPVFRYENVQRGRLRQHHQFGIEMIGSESPLCDAEIINIANSICEDLGIKDINIYINSLGCSKCRIKYNEELRKFLMIKKEYLCNICKIRFDRNPLRILDCKNESCKIILEDVPKIIDFICDECSTHFEEVKKYLSIIGVNYKENYNIVRGLDYYTKTVFEIVNSEGIAICGGGRYDNLVEQLGGKSTPAIGFGMGIERLILILNNKGIEILKDDNIDLFIVVLDASLKAKAFKLCNEIRSFGLSCDIDFLDRSLKNQMKYANKINAKNVIVIGEDEINNNYLNIKNMLTGGTIKIDFSAESIAKTLKT